MPNTPGRVPINHNHDPIHPTPGCRCFFCMLDVPIFDDLLPSGIPSARHLSGCSCFWCTLPSHPAVFATFLATRKADRQPRRRPCHGTADSGRCAAVEDVLDILRRDFRQEHAVPASDPSGWDEAWAWRQLYWAINSGQIKRHPDWSEWLILSPAVAGTLGVLQSWVRLQSALVQLRFDAPDTGTTPPPNDDPTLELIAAQLGWSAEDVFRVIEYKGRFFTRLLNELDVFEQFVEDSKAKVASPRLREMLATEAK